MLGRIDFGVLKGNETLNGQRARVWKKLSGLELFDYCVSNPPYQVDTKKSQSETSTVTNVFQEFQQFGYIISQKTAMIYPGGRWMTKSGKNMGGFSSWLLNEQNLKKVDYYDYEETKESVFPGITIKDGTSIVLLDKQFKNNGFININGNRIKAPDDKPLGMDFSMNFWYEKIENLPKVSSVKYPYVLFGLDGVFAMKEQENIFKISKFKNPPSNLKNPVKCFFNDKPGSSGRSEWYWVEKGRIPSRHDLLPKYKITVLSGMQGNETEYKVKLFNSGEAFGRSYMLVKDFVTKAEAENFKRYLETRLIQKSLLSTASGRVTSFGSYTPILEDYSNNNPLFASDENLPDGHEYRDLNLAERLYKEFNLSDEEIKIIEAQK